MRLPVLLDEPLVLYAAEEPLQLVDKRFDAENLLVCVLLEEGEHVLLTEGQVGKLPVHVADPQFDQDLHDGRKKLVLKTW